MSAEVLLLLLYNSESYRLLTGQMMDVYGGGDGGGKHDSSREFIEAYYYVCITNGCQKAMLLF